MTFQTLAKDFSPVTVDQARELLTTQDQAILFLGRATCPYCNRFIPKLHAVAQKHQLTVHFLDTSLASPALQDLRDHYQVPTVPGLLYASENGVAVRCDSSMTEDEIAQFVGR